MPAVLIVDNDKLIVNCFRRVSLPANVSMSVASSVAEALEVFRLGTFDVVVVDTQLPDASGLQLLQDLQALDRRVPVILMTSRISANTAIEAMRYGAFEYLLISSNPSDMGSVLQRALQTSRMWQKPPRVARGIEDVRSDGDLLVGQCPAMQAVYRQIGRVAGNDVTVLILGESGTGKEVVARAVHRYSKRSEKPFVAINCAAIPEELLESELFGHEKGSFTGAEQQRIGKFEQCDGGTLFLDEIGDMTPLTQTKVLRVLQDQQFERVGGNELVRTNVRLIAATNRNLAEMIQVGSFRQDLFYRLNVYTINLPPLRGRTGDVQLLVDFYLGRFNQELDKNVRLCSPEAMKVLEEYSWPGNLRELQSVLKHAVVEAAGTVILYESLPESVRASTAVSVPLPAARIGTDVPGPEFQDREDATTSFIREDLLATFVYAQMRNGTNRLYNDVIQRVDRALLEVLLGQLNGNVSRASAILGISRSTFRIKQKALGIPRDLLDRGDE